MPNRIRHGIRGSINRHGLFHINAFGKPGMWLFIAESGRFSVSREEIPPGWRESGGVTHEKAPES